MKNKKSLLVWVPLKPGLHWKAEGIAETIENIISEMKNIKITLLVNKEHYVTLNEDFKDVQNIDIVPLSFRWLLFNKYSYRRKKMKFDSKNIDIKTLKKPYSKLELFLIKKFGKFENPSEFFRLGSYAVKLHIFSFLQSIGLFKRFDAIWIPVPILPWIDKLKGNTFISFWDPFGFEYRDFNDISSYLHKNFLITFSSIKNIITQSNNNREFLINILNIDEKKVSVIFSGYPNYSKYIKDEKYLKNELFYQWEKKRVIKNNFTHFIKDFHKEFINHSILFRLKKRLTENTKIIIISTQNRPYKGFNTLFKLIENMNKNYSSDLCFIFTGLLSDSLKNKYAHLHENIFEINRVSLKQHALLYQISDLALHPSFVEGGLGTYPQYEAASVGTPCIINRGRHTDEMIRSLDSALEDIVVDFRDVHTTTNKIVNILEDDSVAKKNIQIIMNSHSDWSIVSKEYENLFLKGIYSV